jgi:hypothetical protein
VRVVGVRFCFRCLASFASLREDDDCGELVRVPYQRPRNCGIFRSPRGKHTVPFAETKASIGTERNLLGRKRSPSPQMACTVFADALLLTLAFLWVLQVGN